MRAYAREKECKSESSHGMAFVHCLACSGFAEGLVARACQRAPEREECSCSLREGGRTQGGRTEKMMSCDEQGAGHG